MHRAPGGDALTDSCSSHPGDEWEGRGVRAGGRGGREGKGEDPMGERRKTCEGREN